ncbi:hypothetical protein Gogos_021012 [Gossypium gossypioides]|uniref:Uncharacterized protein n=1 Tax=Gossypium gossypioides TaxID=34282 RepID=A0A7J9D6Z5_GOSGO|nr:hypothetical protein [Gossypium gossypioides]
MVLEYLRDSRSGSSSNLSLITVLCFKEVYLLLYKSKDQLSQMEIKNAGRNEQLPTSKAALEAILMARGCHMGNTGEGVLVTPRAIFEFYNAPYYEFDSIEESDLEYFRDINMDNVINYLTEGRGEWKNCLEEEQDNKEREDSDDEEAEEEGDEMYS